MAGKKKAAVTSSGVALSVIMPCYNASEWVEETIESLKAQSSMDWECIICDDGSKDDSLEVINRAIEGDGRFTVFSKENAGPSAARNAAVLRSNGRYLMFLDADDLISPSYIEKAVGWLDSHPQCAMWYSAGKKFDEEKMWPMGRPYTRYSDLLRQNYFFISGVIRRSDFDRVGGFDETMPAYEDWELWIRLLYRNDIVRRDTDEVFFYRQHPGSLRLWGEARHAELKKMIQDRNVERFNAPNRTLDAVAPDRILDAKGKILVVIPYFSAGAQGKELSLAIAGWKRHFKANFRIVVVGDYCQTIEDDEEISYISSPRVDAVAGQYLPHIDMVNKFYRVRECYPKHAGFIYSCDDIYAVGDFGIEDVQVLKTDGHECLGNIMSTNGWLRDRAKTRALLDAEGLAHRGFVCHLPVWYEWDKLLPLYERYNGRRASAIYEEIYFNKYFAGRQALDVETLESFYRLELRDRQYTDDDLRRAVGKKIWITNTVAGWSDNLERFLNRYYGI